MAVSSHAGAEAQAGDGNLSNSGPGATAAGQGTEPHPKRQRMQQRGAADGGPLSSARQSHQPPSAGPLPRGKGTLATWSYTAQMQRCEQPSLEALSRDLEPCRLPMMPDKVHSIICPELLMLQSSCFGLAHALRARAGGCMCMHIHQ